MIIHSSFEQSYLILPVLGLVIGMVASMIGGSGVSILPPVLILFFRIPAHTAVATALAAALPVGIAGTLSHHLKGNININIALMFLFTGISGALAGATLTRQINPGVLKIILGIYVMIMGISLSTFLPGIVKKIKPIQNSRSLKKKQNRIIKGSSFGFLAGAVTGLFGTSGLAPLLGGMFSLRLPVQSIAGTSFLVVFINTAAGFAGHFIAHQVDLKLVYLLTSGSIIGSAAGPFLLGYFNLKKLDELIRKPSDSLKNTISFLFVITGLLLITI